jgi:cytochrome P450
VTAGSAETLQITRTCPYAPPEQHLRFLREEPVTKVALPSGSAAWVAARYEDIRTVLSDPRFSADRRHPAAPRLSAEMDPPEHGRARRAVVGEFTVRRMAALRPRIQQMVDEHIDAMLAGPRPADLVGALALPVPSLVICELLGVPVEDQDFFQEHSVVTMSPQASVEEAAKAADELLTYVLDLIDRREREPAGGLISRMTHEHVLTGDITRLELAEIGRIQLIAGHDTTANMLALGALLLMSDEGMAARMREGDNVDQMVEELLRYLTVVQVAFPRVAVRDVRVGDADIRAGDVVICSLSGADRDDVIGDDPERMDPARNPHKSHMAFGYGIHRCVGAELARMELRTAYPALIRRFPGMTPAVPPAELKFRRASIVFGLDELPVNLGDSLLH